MGSLLIVITPLIDQLVIPPDLGLKGFELSLAERRALTAFLFSLTDEAFLQPPDTSK